MRMLLVGLQKSTLHTRTSRLKLMTKTNTQRFSPLTPGGKIEGDWFDGIVPVNVEIGAQVLCDSTFCFKHYYSKMSCGLRIGNDVTIWRTAFSVEENGVLEIGDGCYLANAALVCASSIKLGSRVMLSGGVTIADSDFHPLSPAARLADTIALSLAGNRQYRPKIDSRPVVIEDDVWIGFNVAILKGVCVGARSYIAPGSVVLKDVPADSMVCGNPAVVVQTDDR
jgi:acetyltransferase-like isoleucine patch superfamily enzyme